MLSENQIKNSLAAYGVNANQLQIAQAKAYIALLLRWNRSISLTSISDEFETLRFHFGESAFALSAIEGVNGRLADVGSGPGFPGVPLRIFKEDIELLLIESNSRKCAFLNEVIRELRLSGVSVLRARYEDVSDSLRGSVDIVASRALGGYEELLKWSSDVLQPSGRVILWVGESDVHRITLTSPWVFGPKIPIPGAERRFLLTGSPLREQE
jgi:16S rRNA (guanine527-N7)-methyltransferase